MLLNTNDIFFKNSAQPFLLWRHIISFYGTYYKKKLGKLWCSLN